MQSRRSATPERLYGIKPRVSRADLTNAQRIDYLDATIRRAGEARKKHFQIRMPKTIEPVRAGEPLEENRMVSGSEFLPVSIDLKKMQKNAKKRKEE